MPASFRLQVIFVAAHQRVVAVVVRQRVVLVVPQQVVAVVLQQVVPVVPQQVVAVQRAFAGKIQQTELCLPLQVAITFSFHLPPNEFCF
jgi:hypothetical protein